MLLESSSLSACLEKLYLSPILDLHSGDIVSYMISDRPVLSMVTSMLDRALLAVIGLSRVLTRD